LIAWEDRVVLIMSLEDLILTWRILLLLEDVQSCISCKDEIRVIHIDVGIFNCNQVSDHLLSWFKVFIENIHEMIHYCVMKLLESI